MNSHETKQLAERQSDPPLQHCPQSDGILVAFAQDPPKSLDEFRVGPQTQRQAMIPEALALGGRPSIRLARYFLWIEMRAGDLLVRQRQGAGGRSGEANANTVQRRSSAPLGSFDELFGRPVLVAIHGRGCASSKCCASGIATPIRRAPSPPRETETRASRVPV